MPYLLHGHLNKRKLISKYALNNQCDCKKVAYKLRALWKPGPCRVSSSNISGHKREHPSLNLIKLVYRGECWTAMVSDCYSTQRPCCTLLSFSVTGVVLCLSEWRHEWRKPLCSGSQEGTGGGTSNFPTATVCHRGLMIRHDTQMIIWEQAQGQLPIMTVSCSYYPPTSAANSHNCPHFDICFKILQHKTDVVWLCRGVAQNSVGPFSFPDPYLSRIWVFFNKWLSCKQQSVH